MISFGICDFEKKEVRTMMQNDWKKKRNQPKMKKVGRWGIRGGFLVRSV
jgi:hypothetical protein